MRTMQQTVLDAIDAVIEARHLTPVHHVEYSNRGHVYAMDGLDNRGDVAYDFQDDYCTLTVAPRDVQAVYCRMRTNGIEGAYIRYATDSDKLKAFIARIGEVIG